MHRRLKGQAWLTREFSQLISSHQLICLFYTYLVTTELTVGSYINHHIVRDFLKSLRNVALMSPITTRQQANLSIYTSIYLSA